MIMSNGRGRSSPWWSIGLAFGLALAAMMPVRAAEPVVTVVVDQARLMRLPDRVATLVIGNPLVADAALQAGGTMILTGKGYGTTNLLALDRDGKVLMQRMVHVQAPRDAVFVYRGTDRQSYSCTPTCERRVMLGDADAAFTSILSQTTARNAQAQGAAR
jgi:Flp pilus assembly secretin CpaC